MKKILPFFLLLFFLTFSPPPCWAADCISGTAGGCTSDTYPYLCQETGDSAYWCCDNPGCNAAGVPPADLIGCKQGSCTPKVCKSIAENTGSDLTYVGIFRACMDFGELLNVGIQWAIVGAALSAMVRFAMGAIKYIFSAGNPDSLEEARNTLLYAVAGLLIVAFAWLFMRLMAKIVPPEWGIWFGVPP